MRRLPAAVTTALAAGGLLLATAGPASAKSVSRLGTPCTGATSAYTTFMEQGSRVTLGFGVNTSPAPGRWHTLITDNGNTVIDYTGDMPAAAWGVTTTKDLPRGVHSISVRGDDLTSGESCALSFTFKN